MSDQEKRIQEIRERVAKTTDGTWIYDDGDGDSPGVFQDEDCSSICMMGDDGVHMLRDTSFADAHFIAHARQDIPYLLDLIESLQRERQEPEPLTDDNGCEYHCDNVDDSPWECSKCGAAWSLESGNPFENGMKFCSDCGRPIRSVRWNGWYYNSEDDCGDREIVVTREEYDAVTEPKGEYHD